MSQTLTTTLATASLTPEETADLLTRIQAVPTTATLHDDGTVSRTYGATSDSEAAWERLVTAYLPGIQRAAGPVNRKVLDADEAFSVALEEFTATAREIDLDTDAPFVTLVGARMRFAVLRAARSAPTITIPDNAVATYSRLMHAAGHDKAVAYALCSAGGWEMAPTTFLAIDRAMYAVGSLDAPAGEDGSGTMADTIAAPTTTPGPEESLVQRDLVRWLFGRVTTRQESIIRVRYGFDDAATVSLVAEAGFHPGEVLSDMQVSGVLGTSRPAIQREREKGLTTMRAALQQLVDDES